MSLRCTFCGKEFLHIPKDAEKIGRPNGPTQMIRLTDGSIHNLMSDKVGRRKTEKENDNAV
jgi:hypothetical protein